MGSASETPSTGLALLILQLGSASCPLDRLIVFTVERSDLADGVHDDGLSIFGQFLPVFRPLSSFTAAKFSRHLHPGHKLSQPDRWKPQLHSCLIEGIVRS